MSDVFISYSRRDIAFARLIQTALQESQVDTWIDWDRIPVGERWWQEITEAIEGANVFLLIISRNSLGSKVCGDEIALALRNHKRIVPILVDQLTPDEIARLAPDLPQFNWVVFERDQIFRLENDPGATSDKAEDREIALPKLPQFEEALRKLSVAIHTDWDWVKYHTQLQVEALRWDNNGRDASYVVRGTALEEAEQRLFRATGRDPEPTSLQVEYVTASRQEEARRQQETLGLERKARQRQRFVLVAVAAGLVVSSILGVVAWGQRNQYLDEANARATAQAQTEQQRQVAVAQRQVAVEQRDVAVSRQLAVQAANQIDTKVLSLGLLLANEAYSHSPTMDARSSLLSLILAEPRLRYSLVVHSGVVRSVAISPDGTTVASASLDNTIGLWSATTGDAVHAALTAHTKGVEAVAYSPDGRLLASGGEDGQVILWDVAAGYTPTVLSTAQAWAFSLAFSPDGRTLAVGFTDKSVMVWNVADRSVACANINGRTESQTFATVAFSPDGRSLAVATHMTGSSPSKFAIWDVATCAQVGGDIDAAVSGKVPKNDIGMVTMAAYSPDGTQLAVAIGDAVLVIDPTTRAVLRDAATVHANYYLASIAYSPDGSLMALADGDGTVVIRNAATGEAVGEPMIGHSGGVNSVAFAPDGHSLASGANGGDVALWDLQNRPLAKTLSAAGQAHGAAGVAYSPTGSVLASAGPADEIHLWDTTTWKAIGKPISTQGQGVYVLAFSPDGKVLASGGQDKLVHLWDAATGSAIGAPLDAQGAYVDCLAFSPDGKWLAAGGGDNRLEVWDAATRQVVLATQFTSVGLSGPNDFDIGKTVKSVGFSPDSATLYISRGSGMTYFIPVASLAATADSSRQIHWAVGSSTNDVLSSMSPDGKTVAVANSTGVQLYDTTSLLHIGLPMYGHTDFVTALRFTPDGKLLVSGSQDKTVRLWDPATGQPVGPVLTGPTEMVSSLDISPDGRWLAADSADGTVYLWDLAVGDWTALACRTAHRNLFAAEWQQFLPDEPYHPTCPDRTIPGGVMAQAPDLARSLVRDGRADEAQAVIAEELAWVVATDDDAANNELCWFGSLDGFAAQVLPACDRAVSLASPDRLAGWRDTRGLARALTGDPNGAVEDFQAFVDWSRQNGQYDTMGKQREGWIAMLKQGKNPFDQATLDSLRVQ